jgi:hypothetical protein
VKKITCPNCRAPNPPHAVNCRSCQVNFSLHYPGFFKLRDEQSWLTSEEFLLKASSHTLNNEERHPAFRTSCLILLLGTGASILVAFVTVWPMLSTVFIGPRELTRPPAAAQTLRGYVAGRFLQAHPYIEAVDGQIYAHQSKAYDNFWAPTNLHPALRQGIPCDAKRVQLIEQQSGKIVDCQHMPSAGELCPTKVSVAVTEDGGVWELDEVPPCGFIIALFFVKTMLPVLAFSVILAVGVQVAQFVGRHGRATSTRRKIR